MILFYTLCCRRGSPPVHPPLLKGKAQIRKTKSACLIRHALSFTHLCPHGDSNPSFGLERAASWSSRRWGRQKHAGRARAAFYHAAEAWVKEISKSDACHSERRSREESLLPRGRCFGPTGLSMTHRTYLGFSSARRTRSAISFTNLSSAWTEASSHTAGLGRGECCPCGWHTPQAIQNSSSSPGREKPNSFRA